jgi:hypothetical protein
MGRVTPTAPLGPSRALAATYSKMPSTLPRFLTPTASRWWENMPTFLYRLAIACWVGGASLFTFVLTPTIFKSYNRDMAGGIVGVLFPGYFKWGLVCGVIALATIMSSTVKRKTIAAVIILVKK